MSKQWIEDTALVDAVSRNLFDALPLLPKRLVRVDAITKEFGLPFSNIQILCMLTEQDMTIGDISRHLGIAKPNITPLLDSMRARGLVERTRGDADRRVVHVRLLPEGRRLAAEIQDSIAKQTAQWPESFNHSDVKRLNNALALLVEAAREIAKVDIS